MNQRDVDEAVDILAGKCDEADNTAVVGTLLNAIFYLRAMRYLSVRPDHYSERLSNGFLEVS